MKKFIAVLLIIVVLFYLLLLWHKPGDFAVVYFGAVALATIPMALIAKKKIDDEDE